MMQGTFPPDWWADTTPARCIYIAPNGGEQWAFTLMGALRSTSLKQTLMLLPA